MARSRLQEKQIGGLWIYAYLDSVAQSHKLTLVLVKGMQEPEREDTAVTGKHLDAVLFDEGGKRFEPTKRPPEDALPEAGGPSVSVNAVFEFKAELRSIRSAQVTFRGQTESMEITAAPEEEGGGTRPFDQLVALVRSLRSYVEEKRCRCCRCCRCCCVTRFDVPANRSGRQWDGARLHESFEMNADFRNLLCCSCACCEYRQYVRGSFASGGTPVVHQLPGGALDPVTWREDGVPNHFGAGRHFFYGHRADPGTGTDIYRPNRANGCTYRGWDDPGIRGPQPLAMDLEFRGSIIDTCTGRVKRTTTWRVAYTQP